MRSVFCNVIQHIASLLSPGQLAPQVSVVMYTFLLLLMVLINIFDILMSDLTCFSNRMKCCDRPVFELRGSQMAPSLIFTIPQGPRCCGKLGTEGPTVIFLNRLLRQTERERERERERIYLPSKTMKQ